MDTGHNNRTAPPGRFVIGLHAATGKIGETVGYVAAAVLVVLVFAISLGIVMRSSHIDNSWTYDLDLFALIWVAFVGAAFTALRGHHVTSGISLENMFPRCGSLLLVARFVIIAGFLVIFTISGFAQFMNSVLTHETTIDVMSWPVWVATLALPLGTFLWLVSEIHLLTQRLIERRN